MIFKLTYFDFQGSAEKVRLAFVLNGLSFEDVRINYAQWGEIKPTTKFGQVPLLSIDGGEPIAQSGAMLRYIGRLGDGSLFPTNPTEELRTNEILGLSNDLDAAFNPSLFMSLEPSMYGMPDNYAKTAAGKEHIRILREKFVSEKLPVFLTHLQTLLEASGGPFFGGSVPSIADCQLLPQLAEFQSDYLDHIPTTSLDGHPVLLEWMARVRALPRVAEWYAKK